MIKMAEKPELDKRGNQHRDDGCSRTCTKLDQERSGMMFPPGLTIVVGILVGTTKLNLQHLATVQV